MTETTLDVKEVGGDSNVLPNDELAKVAQRNLEEVGGFHYTAEEKHFAGELQKSLPAGEARELDSTALIRPLRGPIPTRLPPQPT